MRNLRVVILLALVVILVGVGLAVVLPQLTGQPAQQPQATTAAQATPDGTQERLPTATPLVTIPVVVAVQPIGRGQVIDPADVDFREYPEDLAPLSGITDLEEVIGKIARVDLYQEMPILRPYITESLSELGAVGSDAAAVLPPNTRLVAVPMDRITSVAYALQPGDRVDMIISLLFVDIDERFQTRLPNNINLIERTEEGFEIEEAIQGREGIFRILGETLPTIEGPSEPASRPRLSTQMTVQEALVVYVNDFPQDGRIFNIGALPTVVPPPSEVTPVAETRDPDATVPPTPVPPRPDIVALAVSPQEAVFISYLVEARVPITFALRPATEVGRQNVRSVTLDYIMQTYQITLPTRNTYSIEPAITSIRRLFVGDEISLNPPTAPPPTQTP